MAQLNDNPIRVGLLGAGTVGSQTARLLVEQKDELAARIGRPIELVGVACLDPDEVDFPWIDTSLLTTDTMKVATNADRIIGQKAMVTEPIDNVAGTGAVSIGGTVWTARSDSAKPIAAGSVVRILRIEGVKVLVAPVSAAS